MPAPTPAADEKKRKARFTPPADARPEPEERADDETPAKPEAAKAQGDELEEWLEKDEW